MWSEVPDADQHFLEIEYVEGRSSVPAEPIHVTDPNYTFTVELDIDVDGLDLRDLDPDAFTRVARWRVTANAEQWADSQPSKWRTLTYEWDIVWPSVARE